MPLTYEQFRFAFANAVSQDEAKPLYDTYAVPASGVPLFQAAAANLTPGRVVGTVPACDAGAVPTVQAFIAISAGLVAGSVALVGFGLDSVVEVSSGLIILWQFRHRMPETRERQALRMLAGSFFLLAAYVGFESVRTLITGSHPETSPVGIGLAVASLMVMPFISWAQRRTGRALGSNAVVADGTQTLLCTYLSAVLLAGLLLNATLGWGWADPFAGLIIAGVAAREGLEARRGEGCCSPTRAGDTGADTETGTCDCSDGCQDDCQQDD